MLEESFAHLFAESFNDNTANGAGVVSATVDKIDAKYVVVSAGFKSECYIPIEQFYDDKGVLEVQVGDSVMVSLETLEDGFGNTRLSRERARRNESWAKLVEAFENKTTVSGVVSTRVKGGFNVDIDKVRAFLPGSLVDIRPVKDPELFEGKEFEFKVIKIDAKRNNIVVSRRAALDSDSVVERAAVLENIMEGQEIKGVIKNITDYGAFVDLGGIDGLLHITDMAWKRIKHPSEVLMVGDDIQVKVLKVDRVAGRVSLGVKQLSDDPWLNIDLRYPQGKRLSGRVANIMDYGCFVELEEGVEGLVHVSEMDWTNKNVNPNKIVHLGQEVEVLVLEVDSNRRRISLGLKQCTPNPWEEYAKNHAKGDVIEGKIRSVTDFGIFVGLEGGIDGLIYTSDLSWQETTAQELLRKYQKSDVVTAMILTLDPERERISLGLKQLIDDPIASYVENYPKDSQVSGIVLSKDDKRLTITLSEQVIGLLPVSEANNFLSSGDYEVGAQITARVLGLDRKNNAVTLTLKQPSVAKDDANDKHASANNAKVQRHDDNPTTFGDLLKQQINNTEL